MVRPGKNKYIGSLDFTLVIMRKKEKQDHCRDQLDEFYRFMKRKKMRPPCTPPHFICMYTYIWRCVKYRCERKKREAKHLIYVFVFPRPHYTSKVPGNVPFLARSQQLFKMICNHSFERTCQVYCTVQYMSLESARASVGRGWCACMKWSGWNYIHNDSRRSSLRL